MSSRKLGILIATLFSIILLTQFQNCAPEGAFEAASIIEDPLHPNGKFEIPKETPVTPDPKPILSFSPPLMDRENVENILTNAFGPGFKAEPYNLELLGKEFGKNCSAYKEHYVKNAAGTRVAGAGSETCRYTSINFSVDSIGNSNASRSSYLMKSCSWLSQNTTSFNYFLSKVGTTASRNSFSDASLTSAYNLFFVGKPAPARNLLDSMKLIGMSQQSNPNKGWAAIAYTLCSSGLWQML